MIPLVLVICVSTCGYLIDVGVGNIVRGRGRESSRLLVHKVHIKRAVHTPRIRVTAAVAVTSCVQTLPPCLYATPNEYLIVSIRRCCSRGTFNGARANHGGCREEKEVTLLSIADGQKGVP